jgi:hypothetical protein
MTLGRPVRTSMNAAVDSSVPPSDRTRTILPLVWRPSLQPAHTAWSGKDHILGVSLANQANKSVARAVGPIIQVSTISSPTVGSNVWAGDGADVGQRLNCLSLG